MSPPGMKSPDFFRVQWSDRPETLAIDSTHQYNNVMWLHCGHFLMILKTLESSKSGKSGFLTQRGGDRPETLAIDSTHQYNMWLQYGHFLITQSSLANQKS